MSKKILMFITIIIALGIGFGGGILVSSHNKGSHGRLGGKGNHAHSKRKGTVSSGTVLSDSSSLITIQLPNGNTESVYTGNNTSYTQLTSITSSNISKGSVITVIGSKNSNGSVNASKIQLK